MNKKEFFVILNSNKKSILTVKCHPSSELHSPLFPCSSNANYLSIFGQRTRVQTDFYPIDKLSLAGEKIFVPVFTSYSLDENLNGFQQLMISQVINPESWRLGLNSTILDQIYFQHAVENRLIANSTSLTLVQKESDEKVLDDYETDCFQTGTIPLTESRARKKYYCLLLSKEFEHSSFLHPDNLQEIVSGNLETALEDKILFLNPIFN